MSILAFAFPELFPDHHLLVGIEDEPDGSIRVYVGARHKGVHTHVDDPKAQAKLRSAWSQPGHTMVEVPAGSLCDCGGHA